MAAWRKFVIVAMAGLLIFPTYQLDSRISSDLVNWTSANANPQGTNSVYQDQLVNGRVDKMRLAWSISFPAAMLTQGLNSTGQGAIAPPLVVNGTVFLVMNDLEVMALRASDGSVLWTYTPILNRTGLPLGTLVGHVHGLTFHAGNVWLSLPDCSALALNALTGSVAERITRICADIPGNAGLYDYSGTPLVFNGDLVIWTASSVSEGTDAGRGFVSAYNITTSHRVWIWFVSPPMGGSQNWDAESCPPPCRGNVQPVPGDWGALGTINGHSRVGAGPGWGQPAVDSPDGIVIVGTSQPSPDWNATYRPGPNLYSDSIVALSLKDGSLVWFYQSTPHDLYDFDCGWNVALGTVLIGGMNETAVFKACKNGFVYALSAKTGHEIWHFDPPTIVRVNTENANYANTGAFNGTKNWVSSVSGYEQCPGVNGGVESDISVSGGRLFVATHNFCSYVTAGPVNGIGGSVSGAKGFQYGFLHANTTIYALEESSGKIDWSRFLDGIPYRGWLTSTGGIVFASTLDGNIIGLDSATGTVDGITHVGSPLYEGITIGSDSSGNVFAFQLTSSPSYGSFTSGVPGSLLVFAPNRIVSPLPWIAVAAFGGVGTVAILIILSSKRMKKRV